MHIIGRDDAKTIGKVTYFEAPQMKALGLVNHAFCTRIGGVGLRISSSPEVTDGGGDERVRVSINRQLVSRTFGLEPEQLITMDQRHSDRISIIDKPLAHAQSPWNFRSDALLTDQREIAIAVLTADCVPILLVDPNHAVIGIIHAGWQGTLLGIARKALDGMIRHFGIHPEDLFVAIGPSIGECCYEVDDNVMIPFQSSGWNWQSFSRPRGKGKWYLNLAQANIEQMEDLGMREEKCCWMRMCTACNRDIFFSYRAEGPGTGRQISFIQLHGAMNVSSLM